MKPYLIGLMLSLNLSACEDTPDYDYKTIIGNSAYGDWKSSREQALTSVPAEYQAYLKNECRRAISNGWSLSQVKNQGTLNCEETTEGFHCRKKDVELECRQISEFFP